MTMIIHLAALKDSELSLAQGDILDKQRCRDFTVDPKSQRLELSNKFASHL